MPVCEGISACVRPADKVCLVACKILCKVNHGKRYQHECVDFHYDSDSKALKPIYFRNHLINSSVAMVLSSRSTVQPCGR